jgi:hypothetical protein
MELLTRRVYIRHEGLTIDVQGCEGDAVDGRDGWDNQGALKPFSFSSIDAGGYKEIVQEPKTWTVLARYWPSAYDMQRMSRCIRGCSVSDYDSL